MSHAVRTTGEAPALGDRDVTIGGEETGEAAGLVDGDATIADEEAGDEEAVDWTAGDADGCTAVGVPAHASNSTITTMMPT